MIKRLRCFACADHVPRIARAILREMTTTRRTASRSFCALRICLLFALASCVSCGGGSGNLSSLISVKAFSGQIAAGNYDIVNATVPGNPNATVNWAVNGIPNGNSTIGTIVPVTPNTPPSSIAVKHLAPVAVPNPSTVTVSVALQADATVQASTTVVVGPFISISPAAGSVAEHGTQRFFGDRNGRSFQCGGNLADQLHGGRLGVWHNLANRVLQRPQFRSHGSPEWLRGCAGCHTDCNLAIRPTFSASIGIAVLPPNQAAQTLPIQLGTPGSNVNDLCSTNGSEGCGPVRSAPAFSTYSLTGTSRQRRTAESSAMRLSSQV